MPSEILTCIGLFILGPNAIQSQVCLETNRALIFSTVREWKCLKMSIMNMALLAELCSKQLANDDAQNVEVLKTLASFSTSQDLRLVVSAIEAVFDVEASEEKGRFVVLPGVEACLDEKRRLHNGLPDLLHRVAQEELDQVPACIIEYTMLYVPQVGYLLAAHPWWNDQEPVPDLESFETLKFMFISNGVPHFKTRRCLELDATIGDTASDIAEMETSIMIRLSTVVLASTRLLIELTCLASELDAILSLAITALERNWIRPSINDSQPGPISIVNGRHPVFCPLYFFSRQIYFPGNSALSNFASCQVKAVDRKSLDIF